MSLFLLPRGVAARKAAGERKNADTEAHVEGMQVDGPTEQDHNTEEMKSSHIASTHSSKWNDATSRATNRQKASKPIKPRDLAILIETSLSDYALWCNQDLRRFAGDHNTSGYLFISRLMVESPLLSALFPGTSNQQTPSEASIVQSLKDFGTGFLELQMKSINPSRYRHPSVGDGVYKIRRCDWENLKENLELPNDVHKGIWERKQEDWDERVVYVENIPRKYWSLPSALSFVNALAQRNIARDNQTQTTASELLLQHLELPPHAKASQGDIPICKGFAFVTFTDPIGSESFVQTWDWLGVRSEMMADRGSEAEKDEDVEDQLMNLDISKEEDDFRNVEEEASRSGFRALKLVEWNVRKQEYLERQKNLNRVKIDQNVRSNMGTTKPKRGSVQKSEVTQESSRGFSTAHSHFEKGKDLPPHMTSNKTVKDSGHMANADLSYPANCLIFVKNLYPQTNKTALKTLFADYLLLAMQERQSTSNTVAHGGVDYVDWSKGMSSCHVRLPHPQYAQELVRYINEHNIVQTEQGDITDGKVWPSCLCPIVSHWSHPSSAKPLVAEMVGGRAEEIYWEKIPDKIKKAAISRLSSASNHPKENTTLGDNGLSQASVALVDEIGNQRELKRRKKA
ncbi:hypothetical protein CPB86DRAFT_694945 [Serendipita vermifera]|nr:hypothetical protein CPB86DRAFT_694945 [Serendipita vermifera]